MMKKLFSTAMVLALVLGTAVPALGQDVDQIVRELELRGYSVGQGVEADIDALEEVAARFPGVYLVVLFRDPSGGNDLFADDVLRQIGGTVLVVSPNELGAASVDAGADIDAAFTASEDALFDRDYAEGWAEFAGELVSPVSVESRTATVEATTVATAAAAQPATTASGGGGGLWIFLLFIIAIVGLIWWAMRRSKQNRAAMFDKRIDEVKADIQAQLGEAANDILELEDEVLLSDNDEAKELYYAGSVGYAEFQEKLAKARSMAELQDLAEGVDHALWQLESAEAMLDGKKPPPKPEARPDFEPPKTVPGQQRHPELPVDLQMRRNRQQQRASRPRQKSSGDIGGLGAAAVILKQIQESMSSRSGSSGSSPRASTRSASSRGSTSGVDMPNLGISTPKPSSPAPPRRQTPAPKREFETKSRGRRRRKKK